MRKNKQLFCVVLATILLFSVIVPVRAVEEAVKITADITGALVEDYGSPADPRQVYHTAFDNPAMTLHIVGDDLQRLDAVAEAILKLDRSSHIQTEYGTVNGLRIGPPKRQVRNDRPRYDLQLTIEMEMVRT